MEKKDAAASVAFLGGLLCFVVLVGIGRTTGSPVAAWTVVSLICFGVAMLICWDHPGNLWFTGLLLNVWVWLQMILVAGVGQVREHLVGLMLPLVCAYIGAAVGSRYPRLARKRRT